MHSSSRLPRSRFAPSPTGWLHLGHAVNAVFVWGFTRAHGGRVILRIDDHDRGRCRPEYAQGILDDLDWLGLVPDEQSVRDAAIYESSLSGLSSLVSGLVYPCICSRHDIAAIVGDAPDVESPYPGTCRIRGVDPAATPARRVVMESRDETFVDLALGPQSQNPAHQCGDLLVCDRGGNWTYHFSVVVDDLVEGIDVVIRGEDLLQSTGRQIQLARLLGRERPPQYLHHPLVRRPDGSKLSKSDGDTGLRDLRAAGWSAARVLGHAATLLGLQRAERTVGADDLASLFADAGAH